MNSWQTQWANKIIYQIFPRSFYDIDNDGNGDLKGIIAKLDYIQSLNVDIIWLCPIYDTKFKDAGYDVLNYFDVWKAFGSIDDFKLLISEAKKRNIDIMMDIVLNHTSNENKWFIKALESVDNLEHNYYIWTSQPGEEESIFGGSSWEYVPHLKKYYYHLFAKEQVDINWANDATIQAMADVIDFWYNLGVKAFRLDAIQHVAKDFKPIFSHSFAKNMVDYLQKFQQLAFANKPDVFTFGEASGIRPELVIKYATGPEMICDNFYNFSWWWIGWSKKTGRNGADFTWKISDFVNEQAIQYQSDLKILPHMLTNFLTNHDTSRAVSRWGNEKEWWKQSAKALALMMFSLKGIPSIYYGEEIGMLNNHFLNLAEFRDVDVINSFQLLVEKNKIYTEAEMIKYHNINSRDHSRCPMQWNTNTNYGFNESTKPWIKLSRYLPGLSVSEQEADAYSILNFYRRLTKLRKSQLYGDILINGVSEIQLLKDDIILIKRKLNNHAITILINLSNIEKIVTNLQDLNSLGELMLSSYDEKEFFLPKIRPYEALMFYQFVEIKK